MIKFSIHLNENDSKAEPIERQATIGRTNHNVYTLNDLIYIVDSR